jgi:T-complex protein 1 subunit beta
MSSLGPRGKDKIIIASDGRMSITNDGATIIAGLPFTNVALTILKDVCRVQDAEMGDGTTTICCLVAELVNGVGRLVSIGLHPKKIIKNFRECAKIAADSVIEHSMDKSSNLEEFSAKLVSLARTTLSSKVLFSHHEFFSRIVIRAILSLKGATNLRRVKIVKKTGGSLVDSFLDEAFILEKKLGASSPKRCTNPRILIVNTQMDNDRVKIFGTKVETKSLTTLAHLEVGEQKKVLDKCSKILSYKANVLVNRQLIYDGPGNFLTNNGLMTLENADFEGIEAISLLTNGEIVSTFDEPESVRLGRCSIVEEIMVGDEPMTRFGGCVNGGVCSIVLRGSSQEILDEAERSIHDALSVISRTLRNPWVTYGAGFCETMIACRLRDFSKTFNGVNAVLYEECSRAFIQIPRIIAENAGLDSLRIVNELMERGSVESQTLVIDIVKGVLEKPVLLNIIESSKQKVYTILSAFEAVEILSRIDKMYVN